MSTRAEKQHAHRAAKAVNESRKADVQEPIADIEKAIRILAAAGDGTALRRLATRAQAMCTKRRRVDAAITATLVAHKRTHDANAVGYLLVDLLPELLLCETPTRKPDAVSKISDAALKLSRTRRNVTGARWAAAVVRAACRVLGMPAAEAANLTKHKIR